MSVERRLPDLLQELRSARQMTQQDVVAMLGIRGISRHKEQVSRWERGVSVPEPSVFEVLLDAYHLAGDQRAEAYQLERLARLSRSAL